MDGIPDSSRADVESAPIAETGFQASHIGPGERESGPVRDLDSADRPLTLMRVEDHLDALLDDALAATFPASDAVALTPGGHAPARLLNAPRC